MFVLAETPPPKISRSKPCLLAIYATDHLNTSLRSSSGHALVDIFLAIFCTVVQIRLRIRHMAPKIAPDAPRNMVSARPKQTFISYREMRLPCYPVFPSYLICRIKYFLDVFMQKILKYFFASCCTTQRFSCCCFFAY